CNLSSFVVSLFSLILFFFFLLIRRPPISTLFPYTTLFRSTLRGAMAFCTEAFFETIGKRKHGHTTLWTLLARLEQRPWFRRCRSDRKSTRLNSSHDQISYAVFCLKKKKKKKIENNKTDNKL